MNIDSKKIARILAKVLPFVIVLALLALAIWGIDTITGQATLPAELGY